MRFLNKLNNVSSIVVLGQDLYAFDNNSNLMKYEDFILKWEVPINTQHFILKFNSKVILSYWQFQRIVFFDSESGKTLNEFNIPFKPLKVVDSKIYGVCTRVNDLGERHFNISTLSEFGELQTQFETLDFCVIKVLHGIFLLQKGWGEFSVFSEKENKQIWYINLNQLFETENVRYYGDIIEYQDKLFFSLYDDSKSGIYAVDANTGKMVNYTNEIGGSMKLENELIYILNDNEITILDPNTFEIKKIDYSGILQAENLEIGGGLPNYQGLEIKNNLLYFTSLNNSEKDNSREVAVGIIDMKQHKLLEVIRFPSKLRSYNINEIKVHENQLFVLTNDNNLHIFEDLNIDQ
ncbi:hypothetical protein EGI22_17450 [Lacihabitans sp. LS3-19]|uniref:hypothetical protein n=1 Tax=Lacihabitans sp. LS3-19 TaxID=2487335 RepID=UPI0020CB7AE7|nr:hypothetical protein [Lacihabitans sp. LS3-19]MCP9769692.1 hypothetical protein [Lacihabitans sp. LS3-19]